MKTASYSTSSNTREQIIQVAQQLIQTRSYLGFSFQDIADEIGIRKASLYHHFPSKEALGEEVIREATAQFREWVDGMGISPEKKLKAYFLMYRNALHAGRGVCPAGALAPGWDCINDDLRDAVRELRNTQVAWLTAVLEASNLKGARPAAKLASYIFTVCQGALISARMTEDVADFDEVIAQLNDILHSK
ncbi:TetR/AcrR family transcriptional regulator [Undibacterium sp.]|jgi:TetR/AcrR family transcriptional repressor of nem operon|uniref:TetR/AcrR family transcriptional regulator n=1 Tax=Undibacterium sp. TaxID=1914977 RepID=UPI002C271C78|nr:TetR/AcrR family transcriptional regulator [Undibacterium sp.]HTD04674.1 TetR/AcrR family transcriptional regulator [Undibacterium sp.]